MVQRQTADQISSEEYLSGEKISAIKHELIDGHVYAMAGASENHVLITGNVHGELRNHLKGDPCAPYMADMKLKIDQNFYYPDVMVCCDEGHSESYFKQSPVLIAEVLSNSTYRTDKGLKAEQYRTIPSLLEYLLVEQDRCDVELMRRREGWISHHYFLGDELLLESVGLTLPVSEIYQRVSNRELAIWLQQQAV